jgi:hypothetical protein
MGSYHRGGTFKLYLPIRTAASAGASRGFTASNKKNDETFGSNHVNLKLFSAKLRSIMRLRPLFDHHGVPVNVLRKP